MVRYAFDLYPRTDPRDGAVVRRFEHLLEASYRAEENGTGSGQIKVAGDSADGEDIDPRGLQYVRVLEIDDSDVETVKGGFWLEQGKFQALTRKETKHLEFGGAGTLAYLQRAVMWSRTYIHGVFTGQDPIGTTWNLANQSTFYANGNHLGAMLWRVIYEAQHFQSGSYTHRHYDGTTHTGTHADDRTESAIPDVVMTFDQNEDSSGNPWTLTAGTFTAQVGESVLSVVRRLMEMGLKVEMDPDTFELNAWEAPHRTDRTSTTWASGKVLFQAPTAEDIDTGNILSDTIRTIRAFIQRSIVLAGSDNVYAISEGSSDIPWEGGYRIDTEDTGTAEDVAARQRLARSDAVDHLKVVMKLGNAPLQGRYRPWVHVNPGDLVTVDTGADQWEFTNITFPVAALTIELKEGGDWRAIAELGSSFTSLLEPAFQTGGNPAHTHPPNPQLCRPAVFGELTALGLLGAGCSTSGSNILSDHPAWSGDREERVEITIADDVPAGQSLIAVTGVQQQNWGAEPDTVYDEQGNTWTKDAEHENTGSSSDDTVQIWRCNVTNPLSAGDYIRWALNVGSSLSVSVEAGGRCIGVYRFSVPLSVDTVGSGAGSFTGSPSVATPAGQLVVAGMCSQNVTGGDAAFDDMVPATEISGSGDLGCGVFAEFAIDHAADTWNPTVGSTADVALRAVAYSADTGGGAINDGHPDLVGSAVRAARCDHRHDVHRDTAPTVSDDWATAGYKLGTIWAQLDDLTTPTEIVAVWMLIDDSTGAAVWAAWPGGAPLSNDTPLVESGAGDEGTSGEASRSDHVHPAAAAAGAVTVITIPILVPSTKAEPTWDVNSTSYVDLSYLSFFTDFDVVPWTHFAIYGFGRANAAGQTVTFQACHTGTNPLSASGNDVSRGDTNGSHNSGWIPIAASLTGLQRLSVLIKGSNSTVDYIYQFMGIMLKYDP